MCHASETETKWTTACGCAARPTSYCFHERARSDVNESATGHRATRTRSQRRDRRVQLRRSRPHPIPRLTTRQQRTVSGQRERGMTKSRHGKGRAVAKLVGVRIEQLRLRDGHPPIVSAPGDKHRSAGQRGYGVFGARGNGIRCPAIRRRVVDFRVGGDPLRARARQNPTAGEEDAAVGQPRRCRRVEPLRRCGKARGRPRTSPLSVSTPTSTDHRSLSRWHRPR